MEEEEEEEEEEGEGSLVLFPNHWYVCICMHVFSFFFFLYCAARGYLCVSLCGFVCVGVFVCEVWRSVKLLLLCPSGWLFKLFFVWVVV
jgi:hypothetical protein